MRMTMMRMAHKTTDQDHAAEEGGTTKLSIVVGENLRDLRRKNRLSLDQLSHLSGVSRAMLGQIETGKSAPTINLLGRIADALHVSVSQLITSRAARSTVIVPRDRTIVVASTEGAYSSRSLFPSHDGSGIEVYELCVAAGHAESFAPLQSAAKKRLVLASGNLEVRVGEDSPVRLRGGDAILFDADIEHEFCNPGEVEAKAFLIISVSPRT
jgi:transcriptional regulator with XRE-family HTH domain